MLRINIKYIVEEYNSDDFFKKVIGLENEKEGGKRCKLCYFLRLKDTFAYAKENHYDYVTTVMSISNRKNAFEAGMNGHLAKPIDLSKLLETLSEWTHTRI